MLVTSFSAAWPAGVVLFLFFNDTATTEIYTTTDPLSLHDALPIYRHARDVAGESDPHHRRRARADRSEEHTSELQSPVVISYAVFCFKKKKQTPTTPPPPPPSPHNTHPPTTHTTT